MLFLRLLAHALSLGGINGVGIILVDRDGRFLVNHRWREADQPEGHRRGRSQRHARRYLAGRWAILAGALEPGEAAAEGALREVREETGVALPALHEVVSAGWPRPVHLFAAGIASPETVRAQEGYEHRFVTLNELRSLSPKVPLLRAVLRAFAGTGAYRRCLRDAGG